MPTRSDSAPERPALSVYCSTYDRRVGGEERRSRAGGGGTDIRRHRRPLDARATARQAAALLEIHPAQVVVASTGVIGVPLAMDRMQRGLERCVAQLEDGGKAAHDAAEAIMTTDRVPKLAAYAFYDGDRKYVVGGIAKGSGMIAPNMATMLAFIASDYPVAQAALDGALFDACDGSFNMISVDGDMSTNDAVYAFTPPGERAAPPAFRAAIDRVAGDLARAMVADGEGATKLLCVR